MPKTKQRTEFNELWGQLVDRVKERHGWSQEDLGNALGVSRVAVNAAKRQRSQFSFRTVEAAAEAAELDEDATTALLDAWVMERADGGSLGPYFEARERACRLLLTGPQMTRLRRERVDAQRQHEHAKGGSA